MATIVVVDDFPGVRSYLTSVLAARGHRVLAAADAAEALDQVKANRPDLLISDLVLPEMDGFELTRQVRLNPAVAHTPVIFITAAYLTEEAKATAEAIGVQHILLKPLKPETLARTVRQVLSEAAVAHVSFEPEKFEREHTRLLTNKFSQTFTDLESERTRAQAERSQLAAIVASSEDAIIGTTLDGTITSWNVGAERLYGYAAGETIGQPSSILLTRDAAAELEKIMRRMEQGEPVTHYETVHVQKDGTRVHVSVSNSPVRDATGKVTGVATIARDITARKRTEQAFSAMQEFMTRLLENAPAAIYVNSPDGRRLLVNRGWEDLCGMRREEVIGRRLEELFPPENAREYLAANQKVLESGVAQTFEQSLDTADGGRHMYTVKFPLRDGAGNIEAVGGVSMDITERKAAEEKLRDYSQRVHALSRRLVTVQEEERRHLARELHDEIGQVLSAISVNLQAVREACETAVRPRLDESIALVNDAVEQVRDRSLDLRPPMLDVLGLVSTLRWYAAREAERAGFALHFDSEPSGRRLPAETEIACYRVVQEALTNVVRHAKARHVWLAFQHDDKEVRLLIRDDGVGFDPASARERASHGASFGVLGMQERVELLDGTIDIESAPGHGATIRVCLPALESISPD